MVTMNSFARLVPFSRQAVISLLLNHRRLIGEWEALKVYHFGDFVRIFSFRGGEPLAAIFDL